jgi:serine/threonine protein kinase
MNSSDSPVPNAEPVSSGPELPSTGPDKPTHSESDLLTGGAPRDEGAASNLMEVRVGVTLGGFRLVKKLGEGGMGYVFEAEDPRVKRRVAMKVMKPEVAAKESNRQRFLREAQAAALVEHDHIVPILQVGEENNVPFIVMPFLKGEALDVRLKKSRLETNEIIVIARQTAEGLAVAHEQGLIHRDIKPANIWLEESKSAALRAKILDFGLARLSGEEGHLTQSGTIMGTPAYMAPEQARGLEVDHRADLFSLGCVLYEMTTGKRPFVGRDTMAILSSLALDIPVEPIKLNPKLPPSLSQLTMQLLEKDAAKRTESARDVAEALKRLQPESTVVVIASRQNVEGESPWANIDASSSEMKAPASQLSGSSGPAANSDSSATAAVSHSRDPKA